MWAEKEPAVTILYNGPHCGASAPDHAHLQSVSTGHLPLQKAWQRLSRNLVEVVKDGDDDGIFQVVDYPVAAFVIVSHSQSVGERLFRRLYDALPPADDGTEPMMNVIVWRSDDVLLSVVLPRRKHRPACYTAEGDNQYIISPGAVDMGGLIITPREQDFRRVTPELILDIYRELSLTPEQMQQVIERVKSEAFNVQRSMFNVQRLKAQPNVSVGIVSGQKIEFSLNLKDGRWWSFPKVASSGVAISIVNSPLRPPVPTLPSRCLMSPSASISIGSARRRRPSWAPCDWW